MILDLLPRTESLLFALMLWQLISIIFACSSINIHAILDKI
jgi:hypothetical protein